jgi:hypothetical protein
MSPNAGGGGGVAGSQPMSTAVHRSPNKLGDLTPYFTCASIDPSATLSISKSSWYLFFQTEEGENTEVGAPVLNGWHGTGQV